MKQLFSNNAKTTVAATFTASDTTLEVLDGSLFPVPKEEGEFFLLTLLRINESNQETGHEVVRCNARVGNTITVEQRSYEGAAASEFAIGSVVSARLTAKSMENLIAASIAAVELIYDNFDDRYLGSKAVDPATDNDGDPLQAGMLYFSTTTLTMRVYSGYAWQDTASAVEGLGQTFRFTATAGQTEFVGDDDSGAELTFDSVGNLMVFLNGVRLARSVDYIVNGTTKTITLIKPTADLDVLTVDAFSYFASVPLSDEAQAKDGEDNSSLMTPLRTAQAINAMPRKNYIINGNFDIWQRGTFQTTNGYGSADRWFASSGLGGGATTSRQSFAIGQTNVPNNPTHYLLHARTTAATALNTILTQRIENVRALAGKVVTLSLWMKANINKTLSMRLAQSFGTGGSPSPNNTFFIEPTEITTSWRKYTYTVLVPSLTGVSMGTDGNDYTHILISEDDNFSTFNLEVAQVQVEEGNVATDFEYRLPGEELRLCEWYFRVINANETIGQAVGNAQYRAILQFNEMRATPTIINPGNILVVRNGATVYTMNPTQYNATQATPKSAWVAIGAQGAWSPTLPSGEFLHGDNIHPVAYLDAEI